MGPTIGELPEAVGVATSPIHDRLGPDAVDPEGQGQRSRLAIRMADRSRTGGPGRVAVGRSIGTLHLGIPIGIYFLGGETAAETLAELRHWLAINNATITRC